MQRREALKRISLVLGGALSAPTLAGVLGGCKAGPLDGFYVPRTLTLDQYDLVATLTELIIPETDTPGATTAGVHTFIDVMLTEWYPVADRTRFLNGLETVDARARNTYDAVFSACTADEQVALLTVMDREAFPDPETEPEAAAALRERLSQGDPPFFRTLKELTVSGYYTSEVGATQELRVMPMGLHRADVPYDEIGRAWA